MQSTPLPPLFRTAGSLQLYCCVNGPLGRLSTMLLSWLHFTGRDCLAASYRSLARLTALPPLSTLTQVSTLAPADDSGRRRDGTDTGRLLE